MTHEYPKENSEAKGEAPAQQEHETGGSYDAAVEAEEPTVADTPPEGNDTKEENSEAKGKGKMLREKLLVGLTLGSVGWAGIVANEGLYVNAGMQGMHPHQEHPTVSTSTRLEDKSPPVEVKSPTEPVKGHENPDNTDDDLIKAVKAAKEKMEKMENENKRRKREEGAK